MPISSEKWKEFQKGFRQATGVESKPKEEEEPKKRSQASEQIYRKVSVADALLKRKTSSY